MIIGYVYFCPWCGKYNESHSYCPSCRKRAYEYDFWKNATEEQRKEVMEKTKDDIISEKRYTEKDIKKAEEFDRKYHAEYDERLKKADAEKEARKQYVPKCPTCGCPDIEKISAGAKAVDVALFGLWGSKKRKLQFRCKNCGYEW